jgi:hypothetical protein
VEKKRCVLFFIFLQITKLGVSELNIYKTQRGWIPLEYERWAEKKQIKLKYLSSAHLGCKIKFQLTMFGNKCGFAKK